MPAYLETETVDMLTTGIQTKFDEAMDSLAELPQSWQAITTEIPSDGEGELYDWLLDVTPMREWLGDKIVDGLRGRQFYVMNKDYEKTIGIDRNKVNDRRIGAQINVGAALARAANQHDDMSVFEALVLSDTGPTCYDDNPLFYNAHPTDAEDSATTTFSNIDSGGAVENWWAVDMRHGVGPIILQRRTPYEFVSLTSRTDLPNFSNRKLLYSVEARMAVAAGLPQICRQSNQALSTTYWDAAVQAMGAIIGPSGKPLGISPTHIIVGRSKLTEALTLFSTNLISTGGDNIYKGMVEIIYSPRLP